MEKRRLLFAAITGFIAAAAWGGNPYIHTGVYDWTSTIPHNAQSGDQVKALWGAANDMNGDEKDYVRFDDDIHFNPDVEGANTYAWMMVRIVSDHKNHTHFGFWEGYTDSYEDYGMNPYLWNWDETQFDQADIGPTGIWTEAREFEDGIPPAYFEWDDDLSKYVCIVLIEGFTETGLRHMHIDCVRATCTIGP